MNSNSNNKTTSRPAFVNVTEAVINGRLYPNKENTVKNLKQYNNSNENTYNNENTSKPLVRKNNTNPKQQRILNKPIKDEDNKIEKEDYSEDSIYSLFDDKSKTDLIDFQKELERAKEVDTQEIEAIFSKEKQNNENNKIQLKMKYEHLVKEGHNKEKIKSFILFSEKERIRKILFNKDGENSSGDHLQNWQAYNEDVEKSNKRPVSSLISHADLKKAKIDECDIIHNNSTNETNIKDNNITDSVKKQPLQNIKENNKEDEDAGYFASKDQKINNKKDENLNDVVLPVNYYPGMPLFESITQDSVIYRYEDLDTEDSDDVLMVNEYVTDIFKYMYKSEMQCLPNPTTMILHPNIKQNRDILVNWMIKIHNQFNLLPETLYLAVNIMDRFLSIKLVDLDRLQLVGTVSLFIASKYEEVYSPSCKNFANVTDGACCEDDIIDGEIYVLQTLNFKLDYPNPMNFLRRISKADEYHMDCRTVAKYLLEITLVDFRFIGIPPSKCAAAAFFLAKKMMGRPYWDGNFIHYSGGYSKEKISPLVKMMMEYLEHPVIHDEFYKKYSTRRFCKASVASRDWAKRVIQQGFDVMDLHEQS